MSDSKIGASGRVGIICLCDWSLFSPFSHGLSVPLASIPLDTMSRNQKFMYKVLAPSNTYVYRTFMEALDTFVSVAESAVSVREKVPWYASNH